MHFSPVCPAPDPRHLDEFVLWQTARRLAHSTISERTRVLTRLLCETGVEPIDATATDLARWITSHPEWSAGTHCTYWGVLSAFYRWAQAHERRPDNPLSKLPAPRTPERLPRPISDTDLRRLLDARMHTRTRGMILLAALHGLRVHEIAKFRTEDIAPDGETFEVIGKGGTRRELPVHPMLAEHASRMPRRGWWFPANSTRPGQHVHPRSVSQIITRVMERAGVPGTPHALRHWFASRLLADGHDIMVVRDLMRHRNIATTTGYLRLSDETKATALRGIDPYAPPRARVA